MVRKQIELLRNSKVSSQLVEPYWLILLKENINDFNKELTKNRAILNSTVKEIIANNPIK